METNISTHETVDRELTTRTYTSKYGTRTVRIVVPLHYSVNRKCMVEDTMFHRLASYVVQLKAYSQ